MLDIPVMGVNAPKEHQRIIAKLTHGLYDLYLKGHINYEALPETTIDSSKTSSTPDVLLYDNILMKNIIVIEISADGWKKDFRKIIELVEDYELKEGFVYNYVTKNWCKYSLNNGEITENPSFCNSIGYDLNDFLK